MASSIGGTVEPKHLGGRRIDDQLELDRLQDRQVRRLRALEHAAGIDFKLPIGIGNVRPVAHQAAGVDNLSHENDDGSAWRDARSASCTRRVTKIGSALTNNASGRSRASVVKAASMSRPLPVL